MLRRRWLAECIRERVGLCAQLLLLGQQRLGGRARPCALSHMPQSRDQLSVPDVCQGVVYDRMFVEEGAKRVRVSSHGNDGRQCHHCRPRPRRLAQHEGGLAHKVAV